MRPSGRLLRVYRFNRGLTQAELAQLAHLTEQYVSELERGRKRGGVRGWKRLAEALGVEVMDFIEPTEEAG